MTVSALFFAFLCAASSVYGITPEELRSNIETKSKELNSVNEQIREMQQHLESTKEQGKTLKSELKRIDYSINRLDLSIRSSEINIQKLSLELEELQNDVQGVQENIRAKQEAIGALMRELQRDAGESFLINFLKYATLAESLSRTQSIENMNLQFDKEVAALQALEEELGAKQELTSTKKGQVEGEHLNLRSRKSIVEDQKQERQQLLVLTKSKEQTYQRQLEELERRQAEIGKIIEEYEQKLRATFDPALLPSKRPGVLLNPAGGAPISQIYGATAFAQYAYKSKFHNGMDIAVPLGSPIVAAEDGTVLAVDNNDRGTSRWTKYQYGKYVLIKHDNNLATLYAHLSRQIVQKGATVKRGDIIGYSGNTGYSFGPHLHFTVYWAPSIQMRIIAPAAGLVPIGVTIDPASYL